MKNLLNPKWLLFVNTLPIVLLFFLLLGEYSIIKSLMNEESVRLWKIFGTALCALGFLNMAYTVMLIFRKKDVSVFYGVVALLSYIPFIYLYGFHIEKIMPSNIPEWMFSGNVVLYVGTFLMPTLAYSLSVIILHFTPESREHKSWKSFLVAILIPVCWYVFFQILLPLWRPVDGSFGIHAVLILFITGTLVFFFFLVRGLFILASKKAEVWQKYSLVWKIPIAVILPIIGLEVNNGHLLKELGFRGSGIFGDFNNAWFYVLAVLNGIFICLPNLQNKLYRSVLFIARSVSFSFTFYFFLVFLPFLPLSIMAIVAFGAGFLMLAPVLVLVIHVNELSRDYIFLKQYFSVNSLRLASFIGFIVIPVIITTGYLKEKKVLTEALSYVYSPDYSKKYDIDKVSLQKTLDIVRHHKEKNRDALFGNQTPYLSSYFNWIVLDNLVLSDSKINDIENIFYGGGSPHYNSEFISNEFVSLSGVKTKSTYDKSQKAWISQVDLELTNKRDNNWFAEYATQFRLPEGAWISDYYLYIGDKKEKGILAEKKTAMWVFSNIRNENRDPGILFYTTGNNVTFRVFPFAQNEVRKTGFEILHKEPITLTIDSNKIQLGNVEEAVELIEDNKGPVIYISGKQKQALPKVQRKPYFHFLVDVSVGQKSKVSDFKSRIGKVLASHITLTPNSKISFVNTFVNTVPLNMDWEKRYSEQEFTGGFYLDRAIRTALFQAYREQGETYPILVIVADSLCNGVIENNFSDFRMTYPESDLFFHLDESGALQPHSLQSHPLEAVKDSVGNQFEKHALLYTHDNRKIYLADNNQSELILKNELFDVNPEDIKEKNWNSALMMQGKWMSQVLHPESSDKEWLNLVKYSFVSKVMTPVTSYLVVENEAQKAILKKKQAQVLSGNKALDPGEEAQRMSEPGFWVLAVLLGLVLWLRERRRRKKSLLFE